MLDEELYYPSYVTVITNNQELIEKVNKYGEKIEMDADKEEEEDPQLYDDLSQYYPTIKANNYRGVETDLVIVANDIDNYKPNRKIFNIQLHNGNRIDGFDSYIYTDSYTDSAIELLYSMYNCGLVFIDPLDLLGITRGRSFKNYRLKLNELIDESSINQILNTIDLTNKIVLVNFYGSSTISAQEFDIISDSLKQHNVKEDWYSVDTKDELKNDERIISIYVEEK